MSTFLKITLLWAILGTCSLVSAQTETVRIRFLEDTFSVGRPMVAEAEAFYPKNFKPVFPPMAGLASPPFEAISVEVLDQRTQGEVSRSVWKITVRSFDMAPEQSLRLIIGFVAETDTLWRDASSDTVSLNSHLSANIDSLNFTIQDSFIPLTDPPAPKKWPLWSLISIGVLALIIIIAWKPINTYATLRRHQWEWQRMRKQLRQLAQMQTNQTSLFYVLDSLWKHYLDPDGRMNIKTLSTTELKSAIMHTTGLSLDQQQTFLSAARMHDQVIYAGQELEHRVVVALMNDVRYSLEKIYNKRRSQIMNKGSRSMAWLTFWKKSKKNKR